AWLTASNSSPAGAVGLTVSGNAIVQTGGGIVADNSSSAPGAGAGHFSGGPNDACSGGGYGGAGAVCTNGVALGGSVYGSIIAPVNNGSSGGSYLPYSIGGAGGGSIHLNVSGFLDASGRIS